MQPLRSFEEGVRRTAIVPRVLGACAGGVLGYADASPLWQRWREHRRFQDLLATPTVRRATGADWFARHPPGGDKSCDAPETQPADFFDKHPPGDGGPCYEGSADGESRTASPGHRSASGVPRSQRGRVWPSLALLFLPRQRRASLDWLNRALNSLVPRVYPLSREAPCSSRGFDHS